MPCALVALGSNLGERQHALEQAVERLAVAPSISDLAVSGFHETAPIGGPAGQGAFLNAAARFETTMTPEALHELLRQIEADLGRGPAERWAPRAIDLDLLLYDNRVICTPELKVPHPRMTFRRFVLAPAAEVAAAMVHPLIGLSIAQLLAHLNAAVPYVAILGMPGQEKTALAEAVASAVGGSLLRTALELGHRDQVLPVRPAAAHEELLPPPDPSGLDYDRQIQFLDRVAGMLANRDWRQGGLLISDFCFDQCLAYARVELGDREFERFRKAWATRRSRIVAPKLLVVLDAWDAGVRARAAEIASADDAAPADRLRQALLSLAAGVHQGPVVYAGPTDHQLQLDEITAAIAALQ